MTKKKIEIKEEKPKKKFNFNALFRLVVLLALGVLAYAGVMSLIKADPVIANTIAGVVVILLIKETF